MIDSEENNKFDPVVKGLRETGVLNCKQVKEYFVKGHQAMFPPHPTLVLEWNISFDDYFAFA